MREWHKTILLLIILLLILSALIYWYKEEYLHPDISVPTRIKSFPWEE